jgi:hypothetical protein
MCNTVSVRRDYVAGNAEEGRQMTTYAGNRSGGPPSGSLRQETWDTVVDSIRNAACTPFLGAGVSMPYLPSGGMLAGQLADDFDYPLADRTNLARVAQFIASSRRDPAFVRRRVSSHIRAAQREAVAALGDDLPDNHRRLARLELPIYVTTNYDDYLERAFAAVGRPAPAVEICRWNDALVDELPRYDKTPPTSTSPLIFHMHGHISAPDSILVTEDDYIDFTVSLAQRTDRDPVLPHFVRRALGNTNLLFIGYSLGDWNFRVLMRHLMKQQQVQQHQKRNSISIQLSDDQMPPEQRARAEEFLEAYLETSRIEVHWGDAAPFLAELQQQLAEAKDDM